ncbi:MAG: LysR family transcriptional regulator [Lachnospiraceae bacterium]|nr:LysR family transcriptional regulator [Lachnospiraceae bacterium]
MLDYRIATFLVVCQEMNFTKAAQRLKITQPAVSNHIRQLEEYYDALLFGYEGKKIFLTKEGKMLYDAMVSMHNNQIYLMEQISQAKEEREELRFGVTHTVGEFIIGDALEAYIFHHPEADISMKIADTHELLVALESGNIDFAILEGNFQKMDYENHIYSSGNLIPVCSGHNPLAKKSVKLSEVIKERIIVGDQGFCTREILETVLEEKNLALKDFRNKIEVSDIYTIKELVARDCGVAFLYDKSVEEELRTGELAKINITGWNVKHEICAVWKKDNLFSDYYKNLIEELLD